MKGKKKILLAVALVLVMAVGITSIVVIRNRNKTVVKVFPVSMLNSSDWFDTDTSLTGTLTSDYIQEVHIDGGQKVKKVYVKKGDKVKKGDILLKYNVSEKELDLKLQKLQIQSSKMEIAEMEKELKKLKNTKTVGAVNTGNSDVMNASVNLSAIKGTSLSYLVAEANGNTEGTSSDVKVQSGNAVSKSGSGSGSESGSGSGSGSESGSGSGSGSESGSGSGETMLIVKQIKLQRPVQEQKKMIHLFSHLQKMERLVERLSRSLFLKENMQSSAHINRKNLRIQLQHLSFRQTQKLMFMITIIIQLIS